MITVRPIASCGPIADCTICPPDRPEICVYWESSVVEASFLELGNGCLICVPDYCDQSTAYAYPIVMKSLSEQFNCTEEDLFETVVCAPAHNNYTYAPPCGPMGTRGQWIQETYCCSREAA
jgi:hypothetical protein